MVSHGVIAGLVSIGHPDASAPYATAYTRVPAAVAALAAVIARWHSWSVDMYVPDVVDAPGVCAEVAFALPSLSRISTFFDVGYKACSATSLACAA